MNKRSGPRVGLFGILGAGNSGNDASLETVLAYLREAHPERRRGRVVRGS